MATLHLPAPSRSWEVAYESPGANADHVCRRFSASAQSRPRWRWRFGGAGGCSGASSPIRRVITTGWKSADTRPWKREDLDPEGYGLGRAAIGSLDRDERSVAFRLCTLGGFHTSRPIPLSAAKTRMTAIPYAVSARIRDGPWRCFPLRIWGRSGRARDTFAWRRHGCHNQTEALPQIEPRWSA